MVNDEITNGIQLKIFNNIAKEYHFAKRQLNVFKSFISLSLILSSSSLSC